MQHSSSNDNSRKLFYDQAGKRLVDSVIRQRLNSEMPNIRQNVQSLVKTNDPFRDKKIVVSKRRIVPIGSEEKDKIKRSLDFTPFGAINDNLSQEVNLRQKLMESPLVSFQDGEELNRARLIPDNLYVKMGGLTKPRYNPSPQESANQAYHSLKPSLHLADKHYTVSVLEQQQLPRHSSLRTELSARNSFVKMLPTDRQTIELYEPKKFNKLDMQSLDVWLEQTIQQLNSEQLPDQTYLHRLFGTFVCGLKEFIRLTYIDSIDRAALLEKLVWSFVSTFDGLMELQHKINYAQFRDNAKQFNEMKQLFEERERETQDKLSNLNSAHELLNHKYNRLVVVFMSYKTLNRQLVYEVEQYHKTLDGLRDAHEHLKHEHFKLLRELEQSGRINELNGKYYVVNKYNQPDVITHFIGGTNSYQQFQEELDRQEELENKLTKYCSQVDDDFIVGKMVQPEELFPRTAEIGMQSETIETHYQEVGLQNYSLCSHLSDISVRSEDKFENFLGRQLQAQKKQEEHNALVVSLKELYDQVYTDNLRLKGTNQKLQKQIQKENEYNASLLREMSELRQKNLWQESVVKETRLEIDGLHRDIAHKEETIEQLRERLTTAEADLKSERFNNEVFVKNQMELRKRIERMDKEHAQGLKDLDGQIKQLKIKLGKAVKIVNDYLDLIEESNDTRHIDIGDRLQKLFKDDLDRSQKDQKDTPGPFLTSK